MTAQDIIARVLWEVDDEFLDIVSKPELVKALDFVYNKFCSETRVLARQIGMVADGSMEYDLYGSITGGGTFGDNINQFYRIEVGSARGVEINFEDVMNLRIQGSLNGMLDASVIYYAIKYFGKYMRIYFPMAVSDGTQVLFWYYETPRIGTISTLASTFDIDDKYVIELILGLKVVAYRRMIHRMFRKENQNKFTDDMRKLYGSFYSEALAEWKKRINEIEEDVMANKEQITPIIQQISNPMPVDYADITGIQDYWWEP